MIKLQTRYDNVSLETATINSSNQELIKFLKDYIEHRDTMFNECKNVIITGGVGVGKTYLCNCFVNDIKQKTSDFEFAKDCEYNIDTKKYETILDYKTRYIKPLMVNLYDLINDIRRTYKGEEPLYKPKECDILIIDEIGVQRNTEDERFLLYDIINYRNVNFKPTFIISNFKTENEIAMVLGQRILDRVKQNAKIFNIEDKSWRLK